MINNRVSVENINPRGVYMIINNDEPEECLFWSNEQGWVGDIESATLWMGHEIYTISLPISGSWTKYKG